MPDSNEITKNLHSIRDYFLVILLAISLSFLLGPNFGPVALFLITTYVVAVHMPSQYKIQQFALASIFIVGLSPLYLITRGLLTRSNLNEFDLQLYMSIFLLGSVLLILKKKSSDSPRLIDRETKRALLFITGFAGLFAFIFTQFVLMRRSIGDSVAWIASGDSKNHFESIYTLINLGFLNIGTFLTQPSSSPSYAALAMSQVGKLDQSISTQLPVLMQSYSFVWVTLIGISGLTFAALFEIIWKSFTNFLGEVPLLYVLAFSLIPVLSFSLGPVLKDGFFTAIFGISATVVSIAWFIEVQSQKNFSKNFIISGFVIFLCTLMSWMFVVPFTGLILLMGLRSNFKKLDLNSKYVDVYLIVFVVLGASVVHFSSFGQDLIYKAKLALTSSGAVNGTNPNYFYFFVATLALLGLGLYEKNKILGLTVLQIVLIQVAAIFLFKNFSNVSIFEWNYYLLKYQWMMTVVIVCVLLAFVFVFVISTFHNSKMKQILALMLLSFSVYIYSEFMVTTNRTIQKIWSGWENPRSQIMNEVFLQEIDRENPTMFFHYGYGGDAMLANFWLTAFAIPLDPIRGWNYTIDTTGDVQQICDVNAYYPKVTVVTSDMKLEELIMQTCPNEEFIVILKPPIV